MIDGLHITEVTFRHAEIERRPDVLANASIVLNGHFLVRNLLVYRRENGKISVEMPRVRSGAQWFDAAHPVTTTMRGYLDRVVSEAYFAWMGEQVDAMEVGG